MPPDAQVDARLVAGLWLHCEALINSLRFALGEVANRAARDLTSAALTAVGSVEHPPIVLATVASLVEEELRTSAAVDDMVDEHIAACFRFVAACRGVELPVDDFSPRVRAALQGASESASTGSTLTCVISHATGGSGFATFAFAETAPLALMSGVLKAQFEGARSLSTSAAREGCSMMLERRILDLNITPDQWFTVITKLFSFGT